MSNRILMDMNQLFNVITLFLCDNYDASVDIEDFYDMKRKCKTMIL